jgi:hypothetical protein
MLYAVIYISFLHIIIYIVGTCGGGVVVAHAEEEPDDGGGACADVRAYLYNININIIHIILYYTVLYYIMRRIARPWQRSMHRCACSPRV